MFLLRIKIVNVFLLAEENVIRIIRRSATATAGADSYLTGLFVSVWKQQSGHTGEQRGLLAQRVHSSCGPDRCSRAALRWRGRGWPPDGHAAFDAQSAALAFDTRAARADEAAAAGTDDGSHAAAAATATAAAAAAAGGDECCARLRGDRG